MTVSSLPHLMELQARCPEAYQLAKVAALAARIEPALLRSLRLTLLPGIGTVAEADLFHSDIVQAKNRAGMILYPDVAAILRAELSEDVELLDRSWAVIIRHHDKQFPVLLRMQEEITYLALRRDPPQELESRFNKIVATMRAQEAQRGQSLAAWAVRALPMLPDVAKKLDAALRLAVGANARLGGEYIQAPLGSALPEDLHWALPQNLGTHAVAMVREGKDVLFDASDPLPSTRTATLWVPKTHPLLIEVYAESEYVAMVKLQPQKQARLHVGYRMLSFRVPGRRFEEIPSRAQLREIIHNVLSLDSAFEAFTIDFFDNIHQFYTDGMTKDSKINILFEQKTELAIWRALQQNHPTQTRNDYFSILNPKNQTIIEEKYKYIPERWELERCLEDLPLTYQQDSFDLIIKLISEQFPEIITNLSSKTFHTDDLIASLFRYSADTIWKALQIEYPEHCSRIRQTHAEVSETSAVKSSPPLWKLRRLLDSVHFSTFMRMIWVHFLATGRQLSNRMNRVRCTNVLFQREHVDDIFLAIQRSLPDWLAKLEQIPELNPHAADGLPPLTEEQLYLFVKEALRTHDDFESILVDFLPDLYRGLPPSASLDTKLSFVWNKERAHELVLRILQTLDNTDKIYRDIISNEQKGATPPTTNTYFESLKPVHSRASVRKFLYKVFRTSSDFDGFVSDFYYDVYRQFSSAMDRRDRTNLLLMHTDTVHIVRSVQEAAPDQFARFQGILREE